MSISRRTVEAALARARARVDEGAQVDGDAGGHADGGGDVGGERAAGAAGGAAGLEAVVAAGRVDEEGVCRAVDGQTVGLVPFRGAEGGQGRVADALPV